MMAARKLLRASRRWRGGTRQIDGAAAHGSSSPGCSHGAATDAAAVTSATAAAATTKLLPLRSRFHSEAAAAALVPLVVSLYLVVSL